MKGEDAATESVLGTPATARPPSPGFVAIGGAIVGAMTALIVGLGDTTLQGGPGERVGLWLLANSAAWAAVLAATLGANLFLTRKTPWPSGWWALALSYGSYLAAGALGGLARLGAIAGLDMNPEGASFARHASDFGAVVWGMFFLGFMANQYASFMERIGAQQQALRDRIEELAQENAERRRADLALRGSEERFRQTAETLEAIQASMAEGLVVLDSQGTVLRLNRAAESFLGLPEAEARGRLGSELFSVARGGLEPRGGLERLLASAGDESPSTGSFAFTENSNRVTHVELIAFPIRHGDRAPMTGVLLRDVTKDRDLERRRNTFVSVASHELRTPLTTLLGYSELLAHRDPPEHQRKRWALLINEGATRLTSIVDEMLNVTRIQAGKIVLKEEPVALSQVIAEAVRQVAERTEQHVFHQEIGPDTPEVIGDAQKLVHVLVNLADNAVKYSPRGGRIVISTRRDPSADRGMLTVTDEGVGIPPEELERLFSLFHRVNRPGMETVRGTGLGLYIVKELVGLMHGEVWVESTVDRGSTFFVALPAAPSAPGPALIDAAAPTGRAQPTLT